MKTIELTLLFVTAGIAYVSYIYYLLDMNADPAPGNFWFAIGSGIDEFFFNYGVKPKEAIKDGPNRIQQWIQN